MSITMLTLLTQIRVLKYPMLFSFDVLLIWGGFGGVLTTHQYCCRHGFLRHFERGWVRFYFAECPCSPFEIEYAELHFDRPEILALF